MIKSLCIILGTFGPAKECDKNLELKKTQTSIQVSSLKEVLRDTHVEVFGDSASVAKINMAWAHIAIENGRGKLVYNYNLGNIGTHATKATVPFYKVAGSRFRSFLSFKEGARTYWKLLKNKCRIALFYFNAGDAKSAAFSLKNCGYYVSDAQEYYMGMQSLFVETSKIK